MQHSYCTTSTSSHLPLFSLITIALDMWHSRSPRTLKRFHRLHSTLSNIFSALSAFTSHLLYDKSRTASSGHVPGNLWTDIGVGRLISAIFVMVGGRLRREEVGRRVDIRMNVERGSGVYWSSESQDSVTLLISLSFDAPRMKKSSRREASGPTMSSSLSACRSGSYSA